MDRLRVALLTIGATVAVALLAWLWGRTSVAPEEVSLPDTPEPSILAVPVEHRQLEKVVVARATVEFGERTRLSLAAMEVFGVGVVTVAPTPGQLVAEGQVVLEVDGRPVFLFQGDRPAFRPMTPGLAGVDVVQLQEALERLGILTDKTGLFDPSTQDAVLSLYVYSGYRPPFLATLPESRRVQEAQLWVRASGDPECRRLPQGGCQSLEDLVTFYRSQSLDLAVPFGEFLFVGELPVVLGSGSASKGQEVSSAVLDLASPQLTVRPEIPVLEAHLVSIGDMVIVDEELTGLSAIGEVIDVLPPDSEAASIDTRAEVLAVLGEDALPLLGRSVRVRIPIASTLGEVPVVPIAALRSDTSGRTHIRLLVGEDSTVWLEVTPGLEANGLVEVRPVNGEIPLGAWVVVGEDG